MSEVFEKYLLCQILNFMEPYQNSSVTSERDVAYNIAH